MSSIALLEKYLDNSILHGRDIYYDEKTFSNGIERCWPLMKVILIFRQNHDEQKYIMIKDKSDRHIG